MKIFTYTVALVLFAQATHAQETVDLTLDQARTVAMRAVRAGDTDLALRVARELLKTNPDDRAALIVVAAAAPRADAPTEGRIAGVRAFALSETNIQKYEAARLTALAAAREERFTLSTYWLRRSLNLAPNDDARAQTLRDAETVRRANPWSTSLTFSLTPSNNVNGGAEDESVTISGETLTGTTFSADALALSGVKATLGVATQYRLFRSDRERLTAGLTYQGSRVRLDDDTADVPSSTTGETVALDADEFATDLGAVSLTYVYALEKGTTTLQATRGAFEYGGAAYYRFTRLVFGRSIPVADDLTLQLSVQREWQRYESDSIDTVKRSTFRGGLRYRLESGNRLSGSMAYLNADGASRNFTFDQWSLEGGYQWAEPIGPISLSVSAGLRTLDYPDYSFFVAVDGGRQDTVLYYNANIGFPDVTYAGFSPGIVISSSDTDSNVSRFTRNTFSVGLTLNSAF